MNNCGKRFHSEVAKFRFLNELIKVLTPKVTMETEVYYVKLLLNLQVRTNQKAILKESSFFLLILQRM